VARRRLKGRGAICVLSKQLMKHYVAGQEGPPTNCAAAARVWIISELKCVDCVLASNGLARVPRRHRLFQCRPNYHIGHFSGAPSCAAGPSRPSTAMVHTKAKGTRTDRTQRNARDTYARATTTTATSSAQAKRNENEFDNNNIWASTWNAP
jgi:hypothetical protein